MKQFYLIIFSFIFLSNTSLLAETKTWIGPNGNWSDELKWSPAGVPTNTDDVIIPSGLTLDVDVIASCLNITVNDGATMDITVSLRVYDDSIFALGSIVDLVSGSIICTGDATLTVVGQLNLTSEFEKKFTSGTVDIVGSLHMDGAGGELLIHDNGTLKISPTGIFSIDGDATINPSVWTNNFINEGTLVKTAGTGSVTFGVQSANNGGTISAESGSIDFFSYVDFTDGSVINTFPNTGITFNESISVDGELSGELNGTMTLNSNIQVNGESAGTLNFTGSMPLSWGGDGNLQGDQTLINNATIEIIGDNTINGSTLINYGTVNHNSEGNLTFGNLNALFENKPGASFNIISSGGIDGFFGPNNLTNEGTITIDNGNGYHSFSPNVTNLSGGIVNTGDDGVQFGRFYGEGIFNVYGNFQVTGISFSPFEGTMNIGGEEIENVTCTNNFYSDSTAVFNIQINGPTAGTDHDILTVDGLVSLQGNINIELDYAPVIDDEFEIMTYNGTFDDCQFPENVTTWYAGNTYVFDVVCSDSNLVLKVSEITSTTDIEELSKNYIEVIAFPNPTEEAVHIQFQENQTHLILTQYNALGSEISQKTYENIMDIKYTLVGKPGVYFLNFKADNLASKTIRLIKK